ncbi:hypothetical protein N0V91_010566 [Didymella pomorum]|uniref:Uncharacterized protein n=1 Tax=Didymella pomorum TaxID=749634 RepID=A0A9W8Z3C4_9PLEO|nr:hypothetical protein N0V91_010566 [Didymella pomorum]
MLQTQSEISSKIPAPDQHLSEPRIVAQEIVHFLATIYYTASFLKTIPIRLLNHVFNKPEQEPLLTPRLVSLLETIHHCGSFLKTLYLFTASDFPTFAIPTILFGVFGALSGPILTTNTSPSIISTISRIPSAALLIWTNLLIFNTSNQRTPSAVAEDAINKPSRPIPLGRITIERARQVNLILVPIVLALSWAAGVWHTTLLLLAMQWMYNDLRGCDESLLLRNLLIAVGYGLYSCIALAILCGPEAVVTRRGYMWIGVIGLVMLTTQHICDIKDAAGDRLRGRRSAPIVLGDAACRWSVALPILVCSALCPAFFGLGALSYVFTFSLGTLVASRTLFLRELAADRATWKLWAAWTCSLFVLPLIASQGVVVHARMLWEAVAHYACPGHDCADKLNVLAVSGVAMVVKGSSMLGRMDLGGAERNMTVVPSIKVEVVA